jgi:hypothetical protein
LLILRPFLLTFLLTGCVTFDPIKREPRKLEQPCPANCAEANCLDGLDNNRDGLVDCADPSCASVVECVTAPDDAEVGYVTSFEGENCESSYAEVTTLNQGPTSEAPTCSGCSCQTNATCTINLDFFKPDAGTACVDDGGELCRTNVPLQVRRFSEVSNRCAASVDGTQCQESGSERPTNIKYVSYAGPPTSLSCIKSGSPASLPAKAWTTSRAFCGATVAAATCGSGQRCVRKRSGVRCVRLEGDSPCPSEYPTRVSWFRSFGADGRSCEGCGNAACTNATTLTCPTSLSSTTFSADDFTCSIGSSVTCSGGICTVFHNSGSPYDIGATCQSNGHFNAFKAILQVSDGGDWGADDCQITSSVVGTPSGADPTTTCCVP